MVFCFIRSFVGLFCCTFVNFYLFFLKFSFEFILVFSKDVSVVLIHIPLMTRGVMISNNETGVLKAEII